MILIASKYSVATKLRLMRRMSMQSHQAMIKEQMNHMNTSKTLSQGHIVEDTEDPDCPVTEMTYNTRPRQHRVDLPEPQSSSFGRTAIRGARSNDHLGL